jgi:hypothetical protein
MRIIGIEYGEFSEVSSLNPNFKPNEKRIKVILDVDNRKDGLDFFLLLERAQEFFPTLRRHNCCTLESKKCFKSIDWTTDLAHLTEHIIIDLVVKIIHLRVCSGVTCGYFKPEWRFDLFVECPDRKVGSFCSNLAVFLMERFLRGKAVSPKYNHLISLVEYLQGNSLAVNDKNKISQELGFSEKEISSLFRELKKFQFIQN